MRALLTLRFAALLRTPARLVRALRSYMGMGRSWHCAWMMADRPWG